MAHESSGVPLPELTIEGVLTRDVWGMIVGPKVMALDGDIYTYIHIIRTDRCR